MLKFINNESSIPASEISVALGIAPYCHRETSCQVRREFSKQEQRDMGAGKRLQHVGIKAFEKAMTRAGKNLQVHPQEQRKTVSHPLLPLHGQPDGLYENAVLEVKYSKYKKRKLPLWYYLQTVCYMECVGVEYGYVCIGRIGDPSGIVIYRIYRPPPLLRYGEYIVWYAMQIRMRRNAMPVIVALSREQKASLRRSIQADIANCVKKEAFVSLKS